jgi:hypothetical protein
MKEKDFKPFSKIRSLKFDTDCKKLVAVGETHFVEVDLDVPDKNYKFKIRKIKDITIERILAL